MSRRIIMPHFALRVYRNLVCHRRIPESGGVDPRLGLLLATHVLFLLQPAWILGLGRDAPMSKLNVPRASNLHNVFRSSKTWFWAENSACPNLDAMSVTDALKKTILHHFVQLSRIRHPCL